MDCDMKEKTLKLHNAENDLVKLSWFNFTFPEPFYICLSNMGHGKHWSLWFDR